MFSLAGLVDLLVCLFPALGSILHCPIAFFSPAVAGAAALQSFSLHGSSGHTFVSRNNQSSIKPNVFCPVDSHSEGFFGAKNMGTGPDWCGLVR